MGCCMKKGENHWSRGSWFSLWQLWWPNIISEFCLTCWEWDKSDPGHKGFRTVVRTLKDDHHDVVCFWSLLVMKKHTWSYSKELHLKIAVCMCYSLLTFSVKCLLVLYFLLIFVFFIVLCLFVLLLQWFMYTCVLSSLQCSLFVTGYLYYHFVLLFIKMLEVSHHSYSNTTVLWPFIACFEVCSNY